MRVCGRRGKGNYPLAVEDIIFWSLLSSPITKHFDQYYNSLELQFKARCDSVILFDGQTTQSETNLEIICSNTVSEQLRYMYGKLIIHLTHANV